MVKVSKKRRGNVDYLIMKIIYIQESSNWLKTMGETETGIIRLRKQKSKVGVSQHFQTLQRGRRIGTR